MNIHLLLLSLILALSTTLSQAETQPPVTPKLNAAIAPTCPEYIEKGLWTYRFNEWTLSLTPTACGRSIDPTETAYMFYEIVKKFGQSPYWKNNRGMINQLTCHLAIARGKPEWNLDPWRPYVGYNNTVAVGCNVEIPDPDPTFH